MLSIRLDPVLEARLLERANREKVTKSKLVQDLLARALAPAPDPYELLERIRHELQLAGGSTSASVNVGKKVRS